MDLSAGALTFRDAVSARVHGKGGAVKSFSDAYTRFIATISASSITIQSLRSQTSISKLNPDEEDDFEIEEQIAEEGIADATSAKEALSRALDAAYHNFETRLKAFADEAIAVRRSAFLIRVIRHTRINPPTRDGGEILMPLPWLGVGIVPNLQNRIAAEIAKKPLETIGKEFAERKWDQPVLSKPLWEGMITI